MEQNLMHPNNCNVDCNDDDCQCTPKRNDLSMAEHMERIAYHSCGWTVEDFQRFARSVLSKYKTK